MNFDILNLETPGKNCVISLIPDLFENKYIYTLFSTEEETLTEPDVSVLWDVKNGGMDRLNQVTP